MRTLDTKREQPPAIQALAAIDDASTNKIFLSPKDNPWSLAQGTLEVMDRAKYLAGGRITRLASYKNEGIEMLPVGVSRSPTFIEYARAFVSVALERAPGTTTALACSVLSLSGLMGYASHLGLSAAKVAGDMAIPLAGCVILGAVFDLWDRMARGR